MNLKKIQDIEVAGKKILLRLDLDVPLSPDSTILDTTRLEAGLETLNYLLSKNAHIIICGHLGRPKGEIKKEYSLEPVAKWYAENFKFQISNFKLNDFDGWKLSDNLSLLENLRFYSGEETNDPVFAKQLAALADLYVDDAFAVSHRKAASNVGVTALLPSYAGLQFQKEIQGLSKVLDEPQRPLVVIVGGAKLETKLPLVAKMHRFADFVLVGGKLIQETKDLLAMQHEALQPSPSGHKSILLVADQNEQGTDITTNSTENFLQVIADAKTIVWNGPLGKTSGEDKALEGSLHVAQGIIATDAYTVVGGGDSLEFLDEVNLLEKFHFVSTGGGAMLSFLSGETLPGLTPLLA